MHRNRSRVLAIAGALALAVSSAGSAIAHDQHGPGADHLLGSGAFGSIDLVTTLELTETPGLVADVAVNPAGTFAFLANWGEPDCAGPEKGGQNTPDAGAWVVDIQDLEDPRLVTFIPSTQDTRPGEGMQVVNITTKFFSGDMLVMNNEHCGKNGKGGVSLFDVSDPTNPKKLSEHFGDRANLSAGDTNDIHSAFAWDAGDKAYVVVVDNFENADVDILDITNPSRPRLVGEFQLDTRYPTTTQVPLGLVTINLHDMVVKKINGRFVLLASYWDGGFIQLNVDDPANPTLIGDTDYIDPDPELLESTGVALGPEGNGHQAEFTAGDQHFIGTDEDFAPYGATDFAITSGPNAGAYPSRPVPGAAPIVVLADEVLNGPTVYGGYGCPTSAPIPPRSTVFPAGSLQPDEEAIVVLQRGPAGDPSAPEAACFPGDKAHQAVLAGYDAVVFVNHHAGEAVSPTAPFCGSGAFVDEIVGVCTTHAAFHTLFGTAPLSPPWTYPDGPAIGAIGEKINATAAFDGWGYVHLYSNTAASGKFAELDTYAIAEAHDPDFAVGYGDLTVHEVATHPTDPTRSYLSYYAGGLRALEIQGNELVEVGGYLDPNGNNFWGVEVFVRDGQTIILGSDRDSGLWIFSDDSD
jgi:hypothetical protein